MFAASKTLIGASFAAALLHAGAAGARPEPQPNNYVDAFIGTATNYGNTNPGATLPFGMVQLSPQTTDVTGSGYLYSDTAITAFTLTRPSGVPCSMVGAGAMMPSTEPNGKSEGFDHRHELAQPGYYMIKLNSGILVEATATTRTGIYRFTFPSNRGYLTIPGANVIGKVVTGITTTSGICGGATPPAIHWRYEFDQPFSVAGDTLAFHTKQVIARASISYVDDAGAAANFRAESRNRSFNTTRIHAESLWQKALSSVRVSAVARGRERVFYTAVYHALLAPNTYSDTDGRYRGADKQIHTADGFVRYTNISTWDQYRTQFPLLCLLQPKVAHDVVMSMLTSYQEVGHLPRWQFEGVDQGIMVGDGADAMISEAVAAGIQLPLPTLLDAMVTGATVPQPGPYAYPGVNATGAVQRPGLDLYLRYGYVPYDSGEGFVWGSASTSEEYYIDDFAISRVALAARRSDVASNFLARAENWRKSVDPATGQVEPRNRDGSFINHGTSGEWLLGYTESDEATYQWMVPFDLAGLIDAIGGHEVALDRLDAYFSQISDQPGQNYTGHLAMGNEPGFATPWTYLWAGDPTKAALTIARIQQQLFTDTPHGLPGDDDLGATSSWYVWSALGIYPMIPGVNGYAVTPSVFTRITIGSWTYLRRASRAGWVDSRTHRGYPLPSFN